MAGGSDEHNAIATRFTTLFGVRVARGCLSYNPDQRFWIAATGRGRYSDGSIICGKPAHPAHDDQATTNPLVVVEVLSPTSEGDDDGDKRRDFQSLASLQAYVIVAQDVRCVKVYRRTERGEWRNEADVYRGGESFELPSMTQVIAVDEVYDSILDAGGARCCAESPALTIGRSPARAPRELRSSGGVEARRERTNGCEVDGPEAGG